MPAVRELEREDRVARLQSRHVDGHVRLRARMRLHVRVLGTEELLSPVDRKLLDLVDHLSASASETAPSRSTLGSSPVRSITVEETPGSSPASITTPQPSRILSGTSSSRAGSGPPGRFALVAITNPARDNTASAGAGSSGT